MEENDFDLDGDQCWILFPFVGIELSDSERNFAEPLFGDATVVSRSQAHDAAKHARWQGVSMSMLDHSLEQFAEYEFHAFVAVRRQVFNERTKRLKVQRDAESRAETIAAAITLPFLGGSRYLGGKGLLQHQTSRKEISITIPMNSLQMVTWDSVLLKTPPKPIPTNDLMEFVNHPSVRSITSRLIEVGSKPQATRKLIATAAQHLVRSISVYGESNPSDLLQASYTVIELLIGGHGTYKDIQDRLTVLLGEEGIETYDMKGVLKARNNYVHRGQAPSGVLSRQAVGLALTTLRKVAILSGKFPKIVDILRYLDVMRLGDSIESNSAFAQTIRDATAHTQDADAPKFLRATDEA